ncbi:hypothetical protein NHX12_033654 [Muraenolepis orangiensis]|uniref:Uncharacterized protein n=1 Tax=Muraenolepis orangiensis TaxID=630683 RepID=A0A9Q0IIV4_9TELE|nr:hypothetical protein NHX12_033654 [Muraenolepis orangiensis]
MTTSGPAALTLLAFVLWFFRVSEDHPTVRLQPTGTEGDALSQPRLLVFPLLQERPLWETSIGGCSGDTWRS